MSQNFSEQNSKTSASSQTETPSPSKGELHDRISTALKQERFDGDLLLETLCAEKNIDVDGIERTIYTFHTTTGAPVQIVFYPREELPIVPAVTENHQPFVLAGKPRWRNQDEIDSFDKYIFETPKKGVVESRRNPGSISKQTFDDRNVSFFVEQSLAHILDAAALLGGNVTKYHELRQTLSSGKTNDEINNLIDLIIAGNLIDDSDQLKKRSNGDGNALMLLALTGQQSARRVLEHRALVLKKIAVAHKEPELKEQHDLVSKFSDKVKPLETADLVLVHMTKYLPQKSADGSVWEMKTTYEGSNKTDPRITQHFTLNHGVTSAGFSNSWEGTPIAVIVPFESAVKKNGLPENLNTVDTFWEVSPGERMRFPVAETRIVKPASHKIKNGFFERAGNETLYKQSDYSAEDIAQLGKMMGYETCRTFNFGIGADILSSLIKWNPEKQDHVSLLTEESESILNKLDQRSQGGEPIDVFGALMIKGIQKTINDWLDEANVTDNRVQIFKAIEQVLESKIRYHVRQILVNTELRAMGYEVQSGGDWAWGDDRDVTDQTKSLADKLGILNGDHNVHASVFVQDSLRDAFSQIKRGKITQKKLHEKECGNRGFNSSDAQRRLLYEVGVL